MYQSSDFLRSALMVAATVILALMVTIVESQRCTQGSVSMRFKPRSAGPPYSFLYSTNQSNVSMMRSRVFPPIIIQILDSDGNVDVSASTSDISIVATSTTRLGAAGATVAVQFGEAQITGLLVEGTDLVYQLSFAAISSSTLLAVANNPNTTLRVNNITNIVTPVSIYALVFARNQTYVMYPGQPMNVVLDQLVPPISLNVVNSQYLTYPTSNTLGSNYSVLAVPSNPLVVVKSGGYAPVIDGDARFDALILSGPASVVGFDKITFVLYDSITPILSVATGWVTVQPTVVENYDIAFERRDTSYISSQGQEAVATGNVGLPPIRISIRNNLLQRSPDSSGLVITASVDTPYALRGYQVGVVNGIATFANLTISAQVVGRVFIRFTAGTQGALPLASKSIQTGWITVTPTAIKASVIQFLPDAVDSYINYPGQTLEAVLFSTLPAVRMRILDSASVIDTVSTIVVTAKASDGVQFVSSTSNSASGIVEFTSLQFTSSPGAFVYPRITFTVTRAANATSSALPLLGARLVSGIVTVAAAQANYNLRFQPYGAGLFSSTGLASVATINIAMPKIVVELTTSAGIMDSSSSDISITASAAGATLSGNFLRVTSGVAVFDALMFVSENAGSFVLTFTAGNEDSSAPVGGKSIVTGTIRVASGITPAFALRFASNSYIAYPGQVVALTFAGGINPVVLPDVVIELIDSAHNASVSTKSIRIVRTFSTGTEALSGVGRESRILLPAGQSRIRFGAATSTSIGVVSGYAPVLTFTAIETTEAVLQQTVRSGSLVLSPVAAPSPAAALTIVAVSSTAAARGSASVGSDQSMSFTLQLVGGDGRPVAATGVYRYAVTASSSIPLRTLNGIAANGAGVVTFSSIQFAQSVPRSALPVITFTASSTGTTVVSNILPVATGLITVQGPSLESGVDLVAQVLFDFAGFKPDLWIASLARRLNVETSRFLVTRVYYGTSADTLADGLTSTTSTDDVSTVAATTTSVNITKNVKAVWYGTRMDFRVLEPLATSRNTKPSWALANFVLNIKTDCSSAPELYLRRTMNLSSDTTCDWFMFEDQMSSAQQCLLSMANPQSAPQFCQCYIPLIQKFGLRCLGYQTLTDLCLNTLIAEANCADSRILSVCSLLQEEPVSRVMLLATGIFYAFLLIPLLVLRSSGYFYRLYRPDAHSSFPTPVKVRLDESELL